MKFIQMLCSTLVLGLQGVFVLSEWPSTAVQRRLSDTTAMTLMASLFSLMVPQPIAPHLPVATSSTGSLPWDSAGTLRLGRGISVQLQYVYGPASYQHP